MSREASFQIERAETTDCSVEMLALANEERLCKPY